MLERMNDDLATSFTGAMASRQGVPPERAANDRRSSRRAREGGALGASRQPPICLSRFEPKGTKDLKAETVYPGRVTKPGHPRAPPCRSTKGTKSRRALARGLVAGEIVPLLFYPSGQRVCRHENSSPSLEHKPHVAGVRQLVPVIHAPDDVRVRDVARQCDVYV